VDFSNRFHRTFAFGPGSVTVDAMAAGIFLTYMTLFFLPFLAAIPSKLPFRRLFPASAALVIVGLIAAWAMSATPPTASDLHRVFPFLDHTLLNAGIGPILTPDVWLLRMPARPRWPVAVWIGIEGFLLMANGLWAAVIVHSRRMLREKPGGGAGEMARFGCLFTLGFLAVTIQVDKLGIFDRYYFPEVLGLTLVVSIALASVSAADAKRASTLRFVAALAPLALFTTAGLHDYFRWNDARWALFEDALRHGISPANLQAGYEPNGWAGYSEFRANLKPAACIGPCHCDYGWFCLDDSYRVGMNVYGNYEVIADRQPDYWLAKGPPIYLSRRKVQ
jgi:hypothetical protein